MPIKITISTYGGTGAIVDPVFLKETILDAIEGVTGAAEVLDSDKLADHKQLNALIQSAVAAGINLLGELGGPINCFACTNCGQAMAGLSSQPYTPSGCMSHHDAVRIIMEELK